MTEKRWISVVAMGEANVAPDLAVESSSAACPTSG
jgi:hypothetical protein